MIKALYIHIPFCARKCAYCDFASWATREGDPLMKSYARSVVKQLQQLSSEGLFQDCQTAYVGGGTPSLLQEELPNLLHTLSTVGPVRELSFEANPESASTHLLESARKAGATRISLGIQSTDSVELKALGRWHSAQQALDALSHAKSLGFDVSCDLMCAIPHQSIESWQCSLEAVVAQGIDHLSVYPLQIEEGTVFARRWGDDTPDFNSDEVQADRMSFAARMLRNAGFERYEVASYARPHKQCQHNLSYWTGVSYLGLGTSAASMLTGAEYRVLRRFMPQLPELDDSIARVRLRITSSRKDIAHDASLKQLSCEGEALTERQALAEDLMLGARCSQGISPSLLQRARQLMGSELDDVCDLVVHKQLATLKEGFLVPSEQGWLLGNQLYVELLGLSRGNIKTFVCS